MCIYYICSLQLVLVVSEKSIRSPGADVIGSGGPPGADAGTQLTSSAGAVCVIPFPVLKQSLIPNCMCKIFSSRIYDSTVHTWKQFRLEFSVFIISAFHGLPESSSTQKTPKCHCFVVRSKGERNVLN